MAARYDEFYEAQARARANFIQRFHPLSGDDQLVDIGGGTAQTALMLHADAGMTKPVICIDPCEEMLDIARKNGATTIQSTAESFFASKPEYPLKVVLMNGCVHHFQDPDFIFSRLGKLMPDDGVCIITAYTSKVTFPLFKAAVEAYTGVGDRYDLLCKIIESKGLKWRKVSGLEPVEMEKGLWYDGIRNRLYSTLRGFSDEELEQGVEELEVQFKDSDVLKFDVGYIGIFVSKK